MNDLYEFNIPTPMGNIKALVKLFSKNNMLYGYIDTMGKRTEFNNGFISGNNISISGEIPAKITTIKYNITGTIENNLLNLCAKTNLGNFNLQGKKIYE